MVFIIEFDILVDKWNEFDKIDLGGIKGWVKLVVYYPK